MSSDRPVGRGLLVALLLLLPGILAADPARGGPRTPVVVAPTTAPVVAATAAPTAAATAGSAAAPTAPVFDGRRAFDWLVHQVELGPRNPGSEGHARLRAGLRAHADSLGLRHAEDVFRATDPLSGQEREYASVVISAGPVGDPRVWIGAHYDTRPVSDLDPDPARRGEPLPGANDGASGTAVLLHLAELLAAAPPPVGVDLIFFDGEDSGRAGEPRTFCLGSQHLASNLGSFASPLRGRPLGLVVLDMVGERGVSIPREGYSARYAPAWTSAVFRRAAELGVSALRDEPGPPVYDDHVPFLEAGIPAVDLIDFDFPQWHTTADTPAVCSAASLEQVGRLVLSICQDPPEQR
ncbi:MAG: M28 family peptidase [Candidatus Krumholzibacteriia bacterium]